VSKIRPVYESSADLAHESAIAAEIETRWGCQLTKLPRSYGADFVAVRNGVVAVIEVKRRKISINTYSTIMLSLHKVAAMRQWASMCKVEPIFVIQYDDALAYINVAEDPDRVDLGGRRDRGDDQDIEIVYHYSTDRLRIIM